MGTLRLGEDIFMKFSKYPFRFDVTTALFQVQSLNRQLSSLCHLIKRKRERKGERERERKKERERD